MFPPESRKTSKTPVCANQSTAPGPWFAPSAGSQNCYLGFHEPFTTVAVSLHLGGDHYFFRADSTYSWNNAVKMYGVGIYPVNYGWFFPSIGLFPYGSIGYDFAYVTTNATNEYGLVARGRLALGLKHHISGPFAYGVEIGYSPGVVGFLKARNGGPPTRGGFGKTWDTSLAFEWF